MNPTILQLYLATDPELAGPRDLCALVDQAIEAGVTLVQLRDKHAGGRDLYENGKRLLAITRRHGVPLIVNDRVDVMLALGADGVHVGSTDLPLPQVRAMAGGRIVGYSVNTLDDLRRAEAGGADYIGIGPVFATSTKPDAQAVVGLEGLRRLVHATSLPAVAIGGIAPANCGGVMACGVRGVCVISAILGRQDVAAATRAFRAAQEGSSPG